MQSHDAVYDYTMWLRIAQDDLRAAKALLIAELFSQATYFCQ